MTADRVPLAPVSLGGIGSMKIDFFGQLSLAFRAIVDMEGVVSIHSDDNVARTETVLFSHEHGREGASECKSVMANRHKGSEQKTHGGDDCRTSRMDGSVVVEYDTAMVLFESSSSLGMGMRDIEGL